MAKEKPHFVAPDIEDNPFGWGPYKMPDQLKEMPYQPFCKSDHIGKIVDWTAEGPNKYSHKYRSQFGAGTKYTYIHEQDESTFKLVDNTKVQKPFYQRHRFVRYFQRLPRYGGFNFERNYRNLNAHRSWNKNRGGRKQKNTQMMSRDASVIVRADWVTITELEFAKFSNLSLPNFKRPEDLIICGSLEFYDKTYDRISVKSEKPLKSVDRIFHTVTTTDDPVIRKLSKTVGNVYATDAILAHLMCCTQSNYSWDIVIDKVGEKLFFDKRDNTAFDLLTVNETAAELPPGDADSVNSPRNLALEATLINHNFSQQVLKTGEARYKFDEPNPFISDDLIDEEIASVAYRYRKWELKNGIVLVARCEHNSVLQAPNGDLQFLTVKALNEWDSKLSGGFDWRQKLDTHRGGVLVSELRNNAYKFFKWTVQALLAGSDYIKFGYVSRVQEGDSTKHVILGVQQYKPTELATQINLNMNNAWGILQCIIDLCRKQIDGKYLIMKDPNKPIIRLYNIPNNAFDSDTETDSDEEIGEKSMIPPEQSPNP